MKIILNNIIPFKGFKAINLFGVIFARSPLNDVERNHEAIHTRQMKEMLYIFFYIWYIVEYLINLIRYGNLLTAYYKIKFEKEAYTNLYTLNYLMYRKRFRWIYY